jgi:hypothetical protein
LRHLCGVSIDDLGVTVSWREACLLLGEMVTDPSTRTCAALGGWKHPVSREWVLLAQHVDDYRQAHSKRRIRPWPRPWPAPGTTQMGGKKSRVRNARDLLRRLAGR